MKPIILPHGIAELWRDAITEDSLAQWDEAASELLHIACDTRDPEIRDDVLTLALVACERAGWVFDAIDDFELDAGGDETTKIQEAV